MMKNLGLLIPLAWRNLWRNPRRTLITLLVVAIGIWSILMFGVLLDAFAANTRQQALRVLTGEGQIHAAGYVDDPNVAHRMRPPQGKLLQALSGALVQAWTARVRVPAVIQSEYRTRAVTLTGVSPASERKISDLPNSISSGRYLANDSDGGIVLGRDLVSRLKTRLGKRVIVMAQANDGHLAERSFTIVGIVETTQPIEDEFVFTGRRTAQDLLGIEDDISEISFDGTREDALNGLVASLRHAAPGLDIKSWLEFSPIAYALESVSQTYITVWLLIMFVLMAIGIVNTQLMAVFERTREFGLMQALGMRPGTVVLQVTIESALLVGLGILCGDALTMMSLLPFHNGLDLGFLAPAVEKYGMGRYLYPQLDPALVLQSGLTVWVLAIIAALWPARRASRTAPVVAMAQL
jgi:ABC-type lipoprotein release transport system permease subunit